MPHVGFEPDVPMFEWSTAVDISTIKLKSSDIPGGSWESFSSPPRPEMFWGPPTILSNEYQGLFPWG
jgi:hypothetical protein